MKRLDGFVPLYWDEAARPAVDGDRPLATPRCSMSSGFGSGLGSNDIGLDRGQLAGSRIVFFERVGPKVLLVQPNYRFRALSSNPAEVRGVRDAFARSVLWGFTVGAESGEPRARRRHRVAAARRRCTLAPRLRPGLVSLRAERAARSTWPARSAFPKNTEIEVELTFVLQQAAGPPQGGPRPGPQRELRRRRVLRGRRRRRRDRARRPAFASTIRSSSCPTPATRRAPYDPRSGYGSLAFAELRRRARRAARDSVHPPASAREGRPVGEGERRRSSRSSTTSIPARPSRSARAARRRALVEPGVRGRGLSQRLPRRAAARGREPARHPLQRDQLGASLDARLEHRRVGRSIRAPARSSRASSRSARCAPSRTI